MRLTRRLNGPCRGYFVLCVGVTTIVGALGLLGCNRAQPALPPPHALDDASAASQRASEAMKNTRDAGAGSPSAAAAASSKNGEQSKPTGIQ
jgi:hypothetical protein